MSEADPAWPVMSIAEAHARLTAPGERFEIAEMPIRGVMTKVWKTAPPTLRDVFMGFAPTGQPIEWSAVSVLRLADGKVTAYRARPNQFTLMQRFGLTVKAKVSTVVSYGDEIGTDFSDVCRNSIYISGNTMSYDDRTNPAVDEFRNAFDTYEPGQPLHQWSLEGWMAGKSFVEGLTTMGASPTRKGLEDWLRSLNDYTANGLSIPIDFIVKDYPNEPTANGDCTSIAQWQDSVDGWVQRTGPKGDCFDGTFQYATKASDRGD